MAFNGRVVWAWAGTIKAPGSYNLLHCKYINHSQEVEVNAIRGHLAFVVFARAVKHNIIRARGPTVQNVRR